VSDDALAKRREVTIASCFVAILSFLLGRFFKTLIAARPALFPAAPDAGALDPLAQLTSAPILAACPMALTSWRVKGNTTNLSIALPILSIPNAYLRTIEPSISIVLVSAAIGILVDMKPVWFEAAMVTDPGVLVRLGAIGAVMLSVAGAFAYTRIPM
jgi:hypothetical protein